MTRVGIRCIDIMLPAGFLLPEVEAQLREKRIGRWLKNFDVDANDGKGADEWTTDPREAMAFLSATHAFVAYKTQSNVTPLRPDGRPNRPLTAYTIEVGPLP